MKMISVSQAAERWNVTARRVQDLCKRGEIPGVTRLGRAWMIPADAGYPGHHAEEKKVLEHMRLPRETPFLDLTNLWQTAGEADAAVQTLADYPDAKRYFEAQLALSRGQIDPALSEARYLLDYTNDVTAAVMGAILMARCAVWQGDFLLWRDAKLRVDEAEYTNDRERDMIALAQIVFSIQINDLGSLPEWFLRGRFEAFHPDTYPVLWAYYAQYMYIASMKSAVVRLAPEEESGLGLMRVLPYMFGPLIAQARAEHCMLAELYMHIACAASCHHIGDDARAQDHVRRLVALALPDRLYGILAQYRPQLDNQLDDCLASVDPKALVRVRELNKVWTAGSANFRTAITNRRLGHDLTAREREISRLAAFGMTNRQIAARLNIAESTVKQTIRIAIYKSGVNDRSELGELF